MTLTKNKMTDGSVSIRLMVKTDDAWIQVGALALGYQCMDPRTVFVDVTTPAQLDAMRNPLRGLVQA